MLEVDSLLQQKTAAMKKISWLGLAFIMGVWLELTNQAAYAQRSWELNGKVIYVEDGDTLTLLTPYLSRQSIRLSDIDAPETSHSREKPGQPFGKVSKRSLEVMAKGQQATATCYEYDDWHRLVCTVYVNGLDINAEQLRLGMAWANRANRRYVRNPRTYGLEAQAKSAGLGVWSVKAPLAMAPWEWRRKCWKHNACPAAVE